MARKAYIVSATRPNFQDYGFAFSTASAAARARSVICAAARFED